MDVLVVDDDAAVRDLLRRVLLQAGHSVTEAADGVRALEAVGTGRFAIAFLDVYLPGIDGLELIPKVRRQSPDTKIIAMSGGLDGRGMDLLRVAERLGAERVLPKPFAVEEPLQLLAELMAEPA